MGLFIKGPIVHENVAEMLIVYGGRYLQLYRANHVDLVHWSENLLDAHEKE